MLLFKPRAVQQKPKFYFLLRSRMWKVNMVFLRMEFSRESKAYLNFLPFAPFKYQGNPLHLFNPCKVHLNTVQTQ